MKKIISMNLATAIVFLTSSYAAFYLLLNDTFFHASISAIITKSHYLAQSKHMLVVGLLPIYIATIIFGAGIAGIYLGTRTQQLLMKATKKTSIGQNKAY